MKKIIYFLLIIILLAGIAGGGYMVYNHFKNQPEPVTETNILTESQALLKNHASITFGSGDSAWTISTADKVEPIYIDDLRAPGKGVEIGHQNSGGSSVNIPLESFIKVDDKNISNISINGLGDFCSLNYSITKKNGAYVWDWCSKAIYENILYTKSPNNIESAAQAIETEIANGNYKPGDNYYLGGYNVIIQFFDTEKYGEPGTFGPNGEQLALSTGIILNIPVYYRVK